MAYQIPESSLVNRFVPPYAPFHDTGSTQPQLAKVLETAYPSEVGSPDPNATHAQWSRGPSHAIPPFQFLRQSFNNGKYLSLACFYLLVCVAVTFWMFATGPKLVPRQDTRITNAIISLLSRIALTLSLWIVTVLLRTLWVRYLSSGRAVKLRGLLLACTDTGILRRVQYLRLMPTREIGITVIIGASVTICMTLTSAGFKYVVIPITAMKPFLGPDFRAICDYSLVNASTGYFCSGAANSITSITQWNNVDAVNSGAGGNVVLSEDTATGRLSANVTLTSSPANIRLPSNPPAPWAAIDVGCTAVDLQLELVGSGATSSNIVFLNGIEFDTLSIAEMPNWNSQVQLYQQANDTGPVSSLSPWYIVLLARDIDDGTSHVTGLGASAVNLLGNSYVDLHGYGPTLQSILGAAAYCDFGGSTGGTWPDIYWPINSTRNVIVGTGPQNGTLGVATLFLNYGPGWQYNPVSTNSLPGGSVSYVANFTTDAPTFPVFISTYIRNQWALMMYSNNFISPFVTNTSYAVVTDPLIHIRATAVLAIPLTALLLCVGCAISSLWMIGNLGARYKRMDMAPWWLLKALNAMPGLDDREANEDEFNQWAEQKYCLYEVDGSKNFEPRRGMLKFVYVA